MVVDLSAPGTHAALAAIVGVTQQAISAIGIPSGTLGEMVLAYCLRMREQAAGRYSEGPLDLAQERAALARSQREAVDLKNAVARGEFAPITLLSEVLAQASQSIVERFEQLPGQLKRACPALDDAARDQVMTTLAAARNEWVRATCELAIQPPDLTDDETEDAEDEQVAA